MQKPITSLLLAGGILLSASIGGGTTASGPSHAGPSPLDAPVLIVESARGRLLLEGTTASAMHEAGLLSLASDHFDSVVTETNFRPGVIVSDNWESASSRLLYVLAAAESAQAVMRNNSIEIHGVTSDRDTFAARVEFLREELPADTAVISDVMTINSTASHDTLCRRAFAELVIEPVSFMKSSADIRTASYSTLDRMIDFAYDCQRETIVVTGHTDSSGDESWNRRLSLARAQAVADHIARGGIDPLRLLSSGRGSSEPIADNGTARGRNLNRRIEFELQ